MDRGPRYHLRRIGERYRASVVRRRPGSEEGYAREKEVTQYLGCGSGISYRNICVYL